MAKQSFMDAWLDKKESKLFVKNEDLITLDDDEDNNECDAKLTTSQIIVFI